MRWRRRRRWWRRCDQNPLWRLRWRRRRCHCRDRCCHSGGLGGCKHDELPGALPPEVLQAYRRTEIPQLLFLPVFHLLGTRALRQHLPPHNGGAPHLGLRLGLGPGLGVELGLGFVGAGFGALVNSDRVTDINPSIGEALQVRAAVTSNFILRSVQGIQEFTRSERLNLIRFCNRNSCSKFMLSLLNH